MSGTRDGADKPEEYSAADFAPDEFDAIPPHASPETKWLYLFATVVQIGQLVVTAWALNRLSKPELDTQSKILAAVVLISGVVVCVRAWGAAYRSAADDEYRREIRRPKPPR